MLPAAPKDVGRLSDVFISALASVGGTGENRLRLPKVKHAAVILVDGLGYENLKKSPAYSRFLNGKLDTSIRCEFPSTTATSLAGFATGDRSSVHGVIGYSVFDRKQAIATNLLTGWSSKAEAANFKFVECLSEMAVGLQVSFIGPKAYEQSGFTELTMKNATYLVADKIADRFAQLEKVFLGDGPSLSYLYIPELDQAAHKFGVESTEWLHLLEELDLLVHRMSNKLSLNSGVLLTADHGVMDVEKGNQIFLEEYGWYSDAVLHTAGDPRCNFIYLNEGESLEEFVNLAENEFGGEAYVCSPSDLAKAGWTGEFSPETGEFLPDVFLIWKTNKVAYDRRFAKSHHMKLIGQHGGISDAETRVPLIRLGKY